MAATWSLAWTESTFARCTSCLRQSLTLVPINFSSAFSVIFAIACGLLVSAYTGLITPTYVYLQNPLFSSELDLSSAAFWNWYQNAGEKLLGNCGQVKTYGSGHKAITLALCPQVKDPLPYVSAGMSAIEAKYADYDPTTNIPRHVLQWDY